MRRPEPFEGPSRAFENALKPAVRNRDDLVVPFGHGPFDNTSEQGVCRIAQSTRGDGIAAFGVDAEARTLDNLAGLGNVGVGSQEWKSLSEHCRSGGRKQPGATDHLIIGADEQQICRIELVVLVLFLVVLYMNGPVQPVLENPRAQFMHALQQTLLIT